MSAGNECSDGCLHFDSKIKNTNYQSRTIPNLMNFHVFCVVLCSFFCCSSPKRTHAIVTYYLTSRLNLHSKKNIITFREDIVSFPFSLFPFVHWDIGKFMTMGHVKRTMTRKFGNTCQKIIRIFFFCIVLILEWSS